MKRFSSFIRNRKIPILLYPSIIFIGFLSIFLLISAAKSDSESIYSTSSNAISFLDANISQINFEATLAIEKKNYREAARKYISILHHNSNDIATLYNLASCYAHLKKPELAAKVLQHAIDAGMNDLSLIITDSVWATIRNKEVFKAIVERAKILQKERGESFFAECKVVIKGRLRQPDSYDSTKAYPLLILFHGYGSYAESYMSIRDRMGARNLFFAAPQGPYPVKIFGLNSPSYSWFYLSRNREVWKQADPLVAKYILDVIEKIKSRYKISGVYLLGHSQGGALAYMTGINYPDLIDGIICFGAQNPKEFITYENLRKASSKLPIFIGHGWSDQSVKFNEALEARNLLFDNRFNVTFKPFQGEHWLDSTTLVEANKWIGEIESKKFN